MVDLLLGLNVVYEEADGQVCRRWGKGRATVGLCGATALTYTEFFAFDAKRPIVGATGKRLVGLRKTFCLAYVQAYCMSERWAVRSRGQDVEIAASAERRKTDGVCACFFVSQRTLDGLTLLPPTESTLDASRLSWQNPFRPSRAPNSSTRARPRLFCTFFLLRSM